MLSPAKIKLIDSAIEIFAEHGYRGARISDIVAGAEANIAAVNYHFGSKENLYMEAMRQAHKLSEQTHPIRGNLPESASAKEKISSYVRSVMHRSFDEGPGGQYSRIFAKTMYSPDSPVTRVLEEAHDLELGYIQQMMEEYFGTEDPGLIQQAKIIVVCLSSMTANHPRTTRHFFNGPRTDEAMDQLIESQVNVVLAALESLSPETTLTR